MEPGKISLNHVKAMFVRTAENINTITHMLCGEGSLDKVFKVQQASKQEPDTHNESSTTATEPANVILLQALKSITQVNAVLAARCDILENEVAEYGSRLAEEYSRANDLASKSTALEKCIEELKACNDAFWNRMLDIITDAGFRCDLANVAAGGLYGQACAYVKQRLYMANLPATSDQ